MLFNEDFDYVKINEPVKLDIRRIGIGLKQAYRGLGILDSQTGEAIDRHIEAIKKAANSINEAEEDKEKGVYPNDVKPINKCVKYYYSYTRLLHIKPKMHHITVF